MFPKQNVGGIRIPKGNQFPTKSTRFQLSAQTGLTDFRPAYANFKWANSAQPILSYLTF